jgi:hypothetical protein
LIALAIQGMTPDARDLTSCSMSRILRSILSDGNPAADGAQPGDDAPDENPDEVCTPAAVVGRMSVRVDRASTSRQIPLSPRMPEASRPRRRSPREAATTCRRLASLCRFTC